LRVTGKSMARKNGGVCVLAGPAHGPRPHKDYWGFVSGLILTSGGVGPGDRRPRGMAFFVVRLAGLPLRIGAPSHLQNRDGGKNRFAIAVVDCELLPIGRGDMG